MKLLLAALVAFALVLTAHAQSGCQSCVVYGYVDLPATGTTVSQSGWAFPGWGFNCESGLPVDRIEVWYRGDDGWMHPAGNASLLAYVPREDVRAAYAPACPHVSSVTGFAASPDHPEWIPVGTRDVQFTLWRGGLMNVGPPLIRTVTVVY